MSKYAQDVEDVNPNLIPIMNLFSALIPFLLMSATFFKLAIIQITVPVSAEGGPTDIAKEEDKITLNMQITNDGFELSGSSDTLTPDILAKLKASIPRPTNNYDEALYKQLTEAAMSIKGKYSASDTVIVVAEAELPYEVVVYALDAVRETMIKRGTEDTRVVLFPKAVLSSIIK